MNSLILAHNASVVVPEAITELDGREWLPSVTITTVGFEVDAVLRDDKMRATACRYVVPLSSDFSNEKSACQEDERCKEVGTHGWMT